MQSSWFHLLWSLGCQAWATSTWLQVFNYMICKYFIPLCGLCIHFIDSFLFKILFYSFFYFWNFYSFIHMCIHGLGYFAPLPSTPPRFQAESVLP
jgi:hypothetical protein